MVAFGVASLLEGFRCLASLLILSVCQSRFYLSLLMRHEISFGGAQYPTRLSAAGYVPFNLQAEAIGLSYNNGQ